jgi:hypothetical protein
MTMTERRGVAGELWPGPSPLEAFHRSAALPGTSSPCANLATDGVLAIFR